MPELPEVETIRRRLQEVLPGKEFASINIHKQKSFTGEIDQLLGAQVDEVTRRAKVLNISLSNGLHLLTHLKMTGQLIYLDESQRVGGGHPTADWTQELPSNHTRISYQFSDGSFLHFNDMRIFGWMRLLTSEQVEQEFHNLGPDIVDPSLTSKNLYKQFQRRSVPIKVVIMDPKVVAGVGNIYACDALNLARISPWRPAKSLTKVEVQDLLEAMVAVIQRGIDLNGTTFDGKYVSIDGMAGSYQEEVLVYGQEGKQCKNCGFEIQKEKLAGRGTYWCPNCQL